MGNGDIKTTKGKRFNHSYGNCRRRKKQKQKYITNIPMRIDDVIGKANEYVSARRWSKKMICYNCLESVDEQDLTKEHIPAKTLFEGYDDKYKTNRITVPACSNCNGKYSPTDREFRDMIGIIAKRRENEKISKKSVESILKKDSARERLHINPFGQISGVVFQQTPIEDFHKKNFKGLYYYQYGEPLSSDYELFVNIDENDYSEFTLGVLGYLKDMFHWKHSGHPDILSYCIQPFRLGITNPSKNDLPLQENENIVVGCLKYNQEHAGLVIAVKRKYLDEIAQKNKPENDKDTDK